jgi:putative glutamine amidotransferase
VSPRPLIGVTLCSDVRGRWRAGRDYDYLPADYARALSRAGADAVYVPAQDGAAQLAARLDALLVPGGDDFAPPQPYPAEVGFELVPEAQLAFDRALLSAVLARGRPVLGICYGAQLLALQHGGSLYHHLPIDLPAAGEHRAHGGGHGLCIAPGTRLARALATAPARVNSQHHQAIRDPGDGLRVAARAPDGVIEAVERSAGPWCIGVQWHPEAEGGATAAALFADFVAAASAR